MAVAYAAMSSAQSDSPSDCSEDSDTLSTSYITDALTAPFTQFAPGGPCNQVQTIIVMPASCTGYPVTAITSTVSGTAAPSTTLSTVGACGKVQTYVFVGKATNTPSLTATAKPTTTPASTGSIITSLPTPTHTQKPTPSPSPNGLSGGAKAGIGVGVTIGALAAIGVLFVLWRRRSTRKRGAPVATDDSHPQNEDEFIPPMAVHDEVEFVPPREKSVWRSWRLS